MTRRDYEAIARILAERVRDPAWRTTLRTGFGPTIPTWHRAILRRHLELSLEQT
jgi:hypothetical protein